VRDKFDFYQSGVAVDGQAPIKSPGIVAFLRLMEHLAHDGVTTFDFLRGSSSYKQRLATGRQSLFQVRADRARLRLAAYRTTMLAARAARKGFRYCTACARKVQR
jgi:CelD/BcsL family acetyltransferase involved in cellulose biosynthesis